MIAGSPRAGSTRAAYGAAVLVALPMSVWFVRTLADVPGTIVLAALVPALLYATAIVMLDRRDPEPYAGLVAALLAGAVVAACVSHTANAWLLAWVERLADAGEARPLAGGFGAPVVEETAKAATLVALTILGRGVLAGTLDGIVYGALVGVGFAFTENVVYLTFAMLQGGSAGLGRAVYVRALLGGWNHPAFTATTGAALGWAWKAPRPGGRWLVPIVGLALATLQHVIWNAVAASAIQGVLCGATPGDACRPVPTDASLFVTVPLLTVIFAAPGMVTLGAITYLARRHESPI